MTDLISRYEVVGKLKKAYFDKNLQEAKNDPCVIDAMTDWAIRQVKDTPSYSPWHTGTPTEEGNYIAHLRIKSRDGEFIEYDMTCNLEVLLNYIRCQDESEENYLMVKGWLRYEPYEEN